MAEEGQVALAVAAAYAPSSNQNHKEAFAFLASVKERHLETWPVCLNIFLAGVTDANARWSYTYTGEARVFGLSVVDEALEKR